MDYEFFFTMACILGLWLLVSPILTIHQMVRLTRLQKEVAALRQNQRPMGEARPTDHVVEEARPAAQETNPPIPAADSDPWFKKSPNTRPATPEPARQTTSPSWETLIASRWMVWTGAVALVLGVVFLVKFSIDQNLFGPAARIAAGLALGAVFLAAGEWLRRRPLLRPMAALRPEYIPSAVSGAGLISLFGTLYAAHASFGMIGTLPAFLALSLVAAGAIALSLLHGPSLALFGTLAGFAVPALFATPDPSAWSLFPYLTVLTGACLTLVRDRKWWWLGWITVALALLWSLIWTASVHEAQDVLIPGGFLFIVAGFAVLARRNLLPPAPGIDTFRGWLTGLIGVERFVLATLTGTAIVMLCIMANAPFASETLILGFLFVATLLALAYRFPSLSASALLAGLFTFAFLTLWWLELEALHPIATASLGWRNPIVPEHLHVFGAVTALFALLFGLGGYGAQRRSVMPAFWASLSASMPVLLSMFLYAVAWNFEESAAWAALAMAMTVLSVFATDRMLRHSLEASAGAYTAAACATLAIAMAVMLRESWLTVGLAAMLPALAWVHTRFDLPPLRWVAHILIATISTRLLLNPAVLTYSGEGLPTWAWVLYGYGLPALCFLGAAKLFGNRRGDTLVTALMAGAAGFLIALQILETRLLIGGGFEASLGLSETAAYSAIWLAAACILAGSAHWSTLPVLRWIKRVLLAGAFTALVVGNLLAFDPLWTHQAVGNLPVLNLLGFAYGLPAILLTILAWQTNRHDRTILHGLAVGLALILAMVFVSLEVRHAFHGPFLDASYLGDAELYAYSAAWLAFGVAILFGGLLTGLRALRYASLAIVLMVAAKVFLWDLSDLTGLLRAVSFLGLGATLVTIGLIYQRFVFSSPVAQYEDTP